MECEECSESMLRECDSEHATCTRCGVTVHGYCAKAYGWMLTDSGWLCCEAPSAWPKVVEASRKARMDRLMDEAKGDEA